MSIWTKIAEYDFTSKNSDHEQAVEIWRHDITQKCEIIFVGMDWAGEGIRKKSTLKKVIKFLEGNLEALE